MYFVPFHFVSILSSMQFHNLSESLSLSPVKTSTEGCLWSCRHGVLTFTLLEVNAWTIHTFLYLSPFRSVDQNSVHSEPTVSSVPTQGQGQTTHVHPQAPPSSYSQPQSSRHFSDLAALRHQQWEQREQGQNREHPLTRLENALAEVQRCASPDSVISAPSYDNSSVTNGSQGPSRSLSVLEKVSRFERRDRVVKQRSHSTANAHDNPTQQRVTQYFLLLCLERESFPRRQVRKSCCFVFSDVESGDRERPQYCLRSRWPEKHAGEEHQWCQSPQDHELQRRQQWANEVQVEEFSLVRKLSLPPTLLLYTLDV